MNFLTKAGQATLLFDGEDESKSTFPSSTVDIDPAKELTLSMRANGGFVLIVDGD